MNGTCTSLMPCQCFWHWLHSMSIIQDEYCKAQDVISKLKIEHEKLRRKHISWTRRRQRSRVRKASLHPRTVQKIWCDGSRLFPNYCPVRGVLGALEGIILQIYTLINSYHDHPIQSVQSIHPTTSHQSCFSTSSFIFSIFPCPT